MGWCGKVKKGNGQEKGTAASQMQLDWSGWGGFVNL